MMYARPARVRGIRPRQKTCNAALNVPRRLEPKYGLIRSDREDIAKVDVNSHVDSIEQEIMPILEHQNQRNCGKMRKNDHDERDDVHNEFVCPQLLLLFMRLQRDGEEEEAEIGISRNPQSRVAYAAAAELQLTQREAPKKQ